MSTFLASDKLLKWLLFGGILVRIVLYFFISPFGPDAHAEFIAFVANHHRLPITREMFCAHQPPLYYLLAQPFYAFDSPTGLKVTQLLSLILSCANLGLIYILVKRTMKGGVVRNLSFLFATISYSYLTFSLFVSNDVLTFFLGTLCIYLMRRYIYLPTQRNLVYFALGLAAGLLTKGTFLAFCPVALIVVAWAEWTQRRDVRYALKRLMLFGVISLGLGSYKYLENLRYEGRFVVHNLEVFNDIDSQKGVWVGPKSLYNVNLKRLFRYPYVYEGDPVILTSVPLLFYATYWNKFSDTEDNFNLAVKNPSFRFLSFLIYFFALFPTIITMIGGFVMTSDAVRALRSRSGISKDQAFSFALLLLVFLSFVLVISAGLKYDIWSCFHSRLALQAFFGMMMMFSMGLTFLKGGSRIVFWFAASGWLILGVVYVVYFVLESWNSVVPF